MGTIWDAFVKAIGLIISFDPAVREIALRSLWISLTSSILAFLICLPLGTLIQFNEFRGKRILINIIQTFYSLPTVVVGLFVFVMVSKAGPLGGLGLLFTPKAMIIGEMILIAPILTGMTISALSGVSKETRDTAISLGASRSQSALAMLREARFAVLAVFILGFGRAISEVGCAMMVGGNIRGFTRTMTTAISLETGKGEVVLSMALGIILLGLALVITVLFNLVQQRR
jgi:tungstate transport system permease protein